MRRSTRTLQSFEAILSPRAASNYVCPSCRQSHVPQLARRQQVRYASNKNLPVTEKIRRKIWGTDNPPGLADPYGGPSFLEKLKAEREGRKLPESPGFQSQTQLAPPPEEVEPQEIPSNPQDYIPATNWDGLEHFGGPFSWSDLPPVEADEYTSFADSAYTGLLKTRQEFLAAIHQATVEIITFQNADLPTVEACEIPPWDQDTLSLIMSTKVSLAKDGKISLQYPKGQDLVAVITEGAPIEFEHDNADIEAEAAEPEYVEAEAEYYEDRQARSDQFAAYTSQKDESFLSLPLSDLSLRFAFTKRLAQLTGYKIPDPVVSNSKDLSSFLSHFLDASAPKPANVAEALVANEDLTSLDNIEIKTRRQTWVDKEKRRGLWKVIESEIKEAGLPEVGQLKREREARQEATKPQTGY